MEQERTEQRSDGLLRDVVHQVQPSLGDKGFRLTNRGAQGEYHWVEFVRQQQGGRKPFSAQECLMLYHLADHQHIGARLLWRSQSARPASCLLASQLWKYEPGSTATTKGKNVSTALREWVTAAVEAHGA